VGVIYVITQNISAVRYIEAIIPVLENSEFVNVIEYVNRYRFW